MSTFTNNNQIGYQWKPTTKKVVKQQRKDFSEDNSNDDTGISLCIRFVFKNIQPGTVFNIMKNPTIIFENGQREKCSLGFIERIDHIFRRDGNKTFFVHFRKKSWNSKNTNALEALKEMKNGKVIEIINDNKGHFWKVAISKALRPEEANSEVLSNQYEGAESDGEEFKIYPDGPFANMGEFPHIDADVSAEIAEIAEQKGEEKTAEQTK